MADDKNLREGAFYWIIPAFDPDTDLEWENAVQPARFDGYVDGEPRWHCLNLDGVSDWPAIYVGPEITPPAAYAAPVAPR